MIVYATGGYDTTKPHNNVLRQADDATRTVTDYATNPPTTRPYTAAESAEADRVARDTARQARDTSIREAISSGITQLDAARTLAHALTAAATSRAAAARTYAAARTARASAVQSVTGGALTLTALRDEVAQLHRELATVANTVADMCAGIGMLGDGLDLAYTDLAGLGRIVTQTLDDES